VATVIDAEPDIWLLEGFKLPRSFPWLQAFFR
jgi:hypothetical protein